MFSFFKKNTPHPTASDKIAIDTESKHAALYSLWEKDKQLVIIGWFDDSLQRLQDYFSRQTAEQVTLLTAREVSSPQIAGRPVVFAEHYPLRNKEEVLFERLNLQPAVIYSSVDEPLLMLFGGERIGKMMRLMGMKKNELIEHKMISDSIRKAQEKIASKVSFEQSAHSAADWFKINLPAANL